MMKSSASRSVAHPSSSRAEADAFPCTAPLVTPSTRWTVWSLSKLLTVFAVFSAATGCWFHWIDLRFAGPVIQYALPLLWTISLLLLNFLAQPRILAKTSSFQWSTARTGDTVFHALLFPTWLIVACLLANLAYYIRLTHIDRIDVNYHIPMCVPMLAFLAWWLIAMFRWRRVAPHPPSLLTRQQTFLAMLWLAICMIGCGWYFILQATENPPPTPVDLAVVFGHRVMNDGSASDTLRARTMAGVDLYKRHLARRILVSGQIDKMHDGHWESEATAMRNVCLQEGVPDQDILMDPIGVNTRATVFNATKLMRQNDWHTVVGVSSDYHLLRIRLTFADAGMPAFTVAARPTVWLPAEPLDLIRETVALVVYKIDPHYRPAMGEEMNVQHPRIVVHKSRKQLELFDADHLVKTYTCFTGTHPGDKEREGDRKTPEGDFHIVFKNPQSKFHLSLGLDYPNLTDARRGLESGLLTHAQYQTLIDALQHGDMTTEVTQNIVWKTPLGGEIFIHGGGEGRDSEKGSAGCVVVTNEEIEELYAVCNVGTEVVIQP
jgi:uncharacterized SAM-binding protein YcdF (DUF218 family)